MVELLKPSNVCNGTKHKALAIAPDFLKEKVEEVQEELWLAFMPAFRSAFETTDGNTWTVMDGEYTKYLGCLMNRKISNQTDRAT
jgi:hypothetical protein